MPMYEPQPLPDMLDDTWRRIDSLEAGERQLWRRKHLGVWINPTFLNGWFTNVTGKARYQYRIIFNDTIQDKGTIDGGASGTIAYIVLPFWRPPDGNVIWHGSVQGSTLPAQFELNYLTGEVTVTF